MPEEGKTTPWDKLYSCELECWDAVETVARNQALGTSESRARTAEIIAKLQDCQHDFFQEILPTYSTWEEIQDCIQQVIKGMDRFGTFVKRMLAFEPPLPSVHTMAYKVMFERKVEITDKTALASERRRIILEFLHSRERQRLRTAAFFGELNINDLTVYFGNPVFLREQRKRD